MEGVDDPKAGDVTPSLLWALADECTRRAVQHLLDTEADRVALGELADHVAETHSDTFRGRPDRAKTRLHHDSLPRLDEHDLVEYDHETGRVLNRVDERLPPDLEEHVVALDDE